MAVIRNPMAVKGVTRVKKVHRIIRRVTYSYKELVGVIGGFKSLQSFTGV